MDIWTPTRKVIHPRIVTNFRFIFIRDSLIIEPINIFIPLILMWLSKLICIWSPTSIVNHCRVISFNSFTWIGFGKFMGRLLPFPTTLINFKIHPFKFYFSMSFNIFGFIPLIITIATLIYFQRVYRFNNINSNLLTSYVLSL